jgi:mono/diheme cytochrome c family protein
LVVLVLALVAALVVTSNDDGGGGEDTTASGPGAATYTQNCAACHGPSGEGGTGPVLAGTVEARFPDIDDEVGFIESGAPLVGMPAFGDVLSADEIRAVAEYTRGLP